MVADAQDLLEDLERLDDVVFDAMTGDARAIEELSRMWPQLLAKLGAEKLDESREQYLRQSLTAWEKSLALDPNADSVAKKIQDTRSRLRRVQGERSKASQ